MSTLGVVIVTYNAADVICDCLATLMAAPQPKQVVVVDNASSDGTAQLVETWLDGFDGHQPQGLPFTPGQRVAPTDKAALEVIRAGRNGGFAAGVNIGLQRLMNRPAIARIWILNPDTLVPPHTPSRFAEAPGGFGLMGGRILYADPPHRIQIDAGTVNRWTGVTRNLNLGSPANAPLPSPSAVDFISGASIVASRAFLEEAGPMPENYFLYYEEVDWARRSKLPFALCPGAEVYHRAGSSIGSPTLDRPPSALSVYHKHRARMMYQRRYAPWALPTAYAYGIAKTGQAILAGQRVQARAIMRALHGVKPLSDIAAQPRHQAVKRGT